MKRILFLAAHYPYPPHQGGAMRNYGMIDGLARRGHQISVLSFHDAKGGPPDPRDPLASLCQAVTTIPSPARGAAARLRDLLAGHADMARRFWSAPFMAAVRGLRGEPALDAIITPIEMFGYLSALRQSQPSAAIVYDALNAEYDLQWRIALQDLKSPARWPVAAYSLIQTARLRQVETGLCDAASRVIACSEADAAKLGALPHRAPITVIPNAIRVADYRGDIRPADLPRPAIVFTGKMDFRPNVDAALWLADDILPIIRRTIPAAQLIIVGQKPHARLSHLPERGGITLTGFVPETQPYLAAADVYVAPLRMGSGTRFKLLEAMAMGKAIVSTRLGAEGLSVEDGREMRLADTAEFFAEAVVDLLADDHRRRALGRAAQELVRAKYDWDAVIPRLEAALG